MKINSNTRIKVLLDADQEKVIDALVDLNTNFSKLRNPLLRNLLARRVTIACKVGKCTVEDFLKSMKQIGFVIDETIEKTNATEENLIDFSRPATLLELDARSFLQQNKDPLKDILQMTTQMRIGDRLKIINSFEPVPLIHLLADRGFLHHTEHIEDKLVVTWFEKTTAASVLVELPPEYQQDNEQVLFEKIFQGVAKNKIKYIDVRHLEMPQPMMQIIENIQDLKDDELLYVYHKKSPVYLLPELKKRGLMFVLNHKSPTELDMLIYRS